MYNNMTVSTPIGVINIGTTPSSGVTAPMEEIRRESERLSKKDLIPPIVKENEEEMVIDKKIRSHEPTSARQQPTTTSK